MHCVVCPFTLQLNPSASLIKYQDGVNTTWTRKWLLMPVLTGPRCRADTLITTKALPLCQTAIMYGEDELYRLLLNEQQHFSYTNRPMVVLCVKHCARENHQSTTNSSRILRRLMSWKSPDRPSRRSCHKNHRQCSGKLHQALDCLHGCGACFEHLQ